MFENVFGNIQDRNTEVKVVGIWGKDGLELEKKIFGDTSDLDLELIGAEIADVISKVDASRLSPRQYYSEYQLKQHRLFVYSLTSEYFLIILAESGVIPGKLRFYVDLNRQKFISFF